MTLAMSIKPRAVALALVVGGAVLLTAFMLHRRPRVVTRPLDTVPADAFVAIDVDVLALRRSGALAALFGDKDEQSLTKVCGFDPVDRMQELVFTVPEGSDGDFGVAVQANVGEEDLLRCASLVTKARGEDGASDTARYGSYTLITPRKASPAARAPRSLGYQAGAPILVGPRVWRERMVDALDAVSEGRGSPGEHAALRKRLDEGITPKPTWLLTGTVVLEKSVREKLRMEMAAEVGPGNDSGTAMMLGVLGMSSAALGLHERAEEIRLVVDLHCEEEPQCAEVEKLIAKVRGEWSKMPELRAFGLGPVVDRIEVDHHGTSLEVRTAAPTADVVRWVKLLLDARPAGRVRATPLPTAGPPSSGRVMGPALAAPSSSSSPTRTPP